MSKRVESLQDLDLQQFLVSTVGALLVGVLYFTLSSSLVIGPGWLLLVIEIVLLAPALISVLMFRRKLPFRVARSLTLLLLVVVAASLVASLVLLVHHLQDFHSTFSLLQEAGEIYGMNILIFATWYWEIDGDGPVRRRLRGHEAADFQFPQQQNGNPSKWMPGYVDYLFLAFCFATALSPADTPPISRRGKLLMMAEAIIALVVVAVLVGRSINIGS